MRDPVLEALNRSAEEGYGPGEIDLVINHLRKHRSDLERGIKPKKDEGPDPFTVLNLPPPKLDLSNRRRTI